MEVDLFFETACAADGSPYLIQVGKQKKYTIGTNEYKTANVKETKSIIYNNTDVQKLVDRYAGKGTRVRGEKGVHGYQERIQSNKVVGEYIDRQGTNWGPTKNFTIHYSKSGVHIVPARP